MTNVIEFSTLYNKAKGIFTKETNKNIKETSIIAGILRVLSVFVGDLYNYIFKRTKNRLWIAELSLNELREVGQSINVIELSATRSYGQINIIGDLNTIIPQNTEFFYDNSIYITDAEQTIELINIAVAKITRVGTIATITSETKLNLGSGLIVNISGFSETNFNKNNISINMISDYQLTFDVNNIGAIEDVNGVLSFNGCYIDIHSNEYGVETELSNGIHLIADIVEISQAIVSFNGITGGTDTEDESSYRNRIIDFFINNRNNDVSTKIINTIQLKFPNITHGIQIQNFNHTIQITKIERDLNDDLRTRKLTSLIKHGLLGGEPFISLTGSNKPEFNITNFNTFNRYVGKIYNDYSFSIFTNNNTSSDDVTSPNMFFTPYYYGLTSLVLYKNNSIQKELTTQEIADIKQYLQDEIVVFTGNYRINTAETENVNVVISELQPNINSLKTTINDNINKYIINNIVIGEKILKTTIDYVIANSIDNNGNTLKYYKTNIASDIIPSNQLKFINLIITFI